MLKTSNLSLNSLGNYFWAKQKTIAAHESISGFKPNFLMRRRLIPVANAYDGDKFFTVQNGVRVATPLLLVLAVVELSDVVFAVDSIPAVRHLNGSNRARVQGSATAPGVPAVIELNDVVFAVENTLAVRHGGLGF